MGFILTDVNRVNFFSQVSGVRDVVNEINEATVFATEQKAQNTIKAMPTGMNYIRWQIMEYTKPESYLPDSDYVEVDYAQESINMSNFMKCLRGNREILTRQLKAIDLELIDVEHMIELSNFNAVQGYNAYKIIKETRIKRREIKDNLMMIDNILTSELVDIERGKLIACIDGLRTRKYAPRVRPELFDVKDDTTIGKMPIDNK